MCGSEVWGLIKAGTELDNVHNRLFSKLMDIQNCVANEFAEIELGRQWERQVHSTGCKILVFGCVWT